MLIFLILKVKSYTCDFRLFGIKDIEKAIEKDSMAQIVTVILFPASKGRASLM